LRCTPTTVSVSYVEYFQFDNRTSLNNDYQNVLTNNSITSDSGSAQCSTGTPSESAYTVDGVDKGRVVCFLDRKDGTATVWWTDSDRNILVLASRNDTDLLALGQFWTNGEASPV
jgi:hypothetical protein